MAKNYEQDCIDNKIKHTSMKICNEKNTYIRYERKE